MSLLLGRYRLGPVIARGGMSTVHRGLDTQLGRAVAIKLLAPHLSADPLFRRRMLEEARAAARLPHPHIVQVFDSGETDDGQVALVLELVDGHSLAERLAQGPLPLGQAVEIAAQVADALAYAHSRGVIHRDVKPGNVLLAAGDRSTRSDPPTPDTSVRAKLADFGIARSLDATSTFTATGLVMGSVPYMAPELLDGAPASPASDVYALAVTLFRMLTGRLPFAAATEASALAARLAREAPRVHTLRAEVPAWLDDLVADALARDPSQRVPDATTFAHRLRHQDATTQVVPVASSLSTTKTVAVPAPVRRRVRRRAPVLAGLAAIAATLGLAAWAGAASTGRPPAGAAQPTSGAATVPAPTASPPATPAPSPTTPPEPPTPTAVVIRPR